MLQKVEFSNKKCSECTQTMKKFKIWTFSVKDTTHGRLRENHIFTLN